jgi:hypothetical protein
MVLKDSFYPSTPFDKLPINGPLAHPLHHLNHDHAANQ